MLVDICCIGSPERPPSSFLISLAKLSLLLFVVFVSIIPEISFFIATSAISNTQLSLISGETFNKSGIFVLFSFFILLLTGIAILTNQLQVLGFFILEYFPPLGNIG